MFALTLTELQALSSNSLYVIVEGATHDSLVVERGPALVEVDAIHRILEAARTGERFGGAEGDAMSVIS
jgi:hypothetical protein